MKVAVLADIHANADALEPTLAEARREGAERLLLLGDYLGYYCKPGLTLELLRHWSCDAVLGNHDRLFLEARSDAAGLARYRAKYGPALDVAVEELSAIDVEWLRSLPERRNVQIGSVRALLCHGSPREPDQYVYWNSEQSRLIECEEPAVDAVFMGHTHHPFVRPGKPWLLNPGSVGQARDIGGFSSWCMFDSELCTVSFRRTPYDVAATLAAIDGLTPDLLRHRQVLARRNPPLKSALNEGVE